MKGLKKICIILCVVMMQLGIGYVVNAAEDSDEVVKEGVKIDSVNVGDMTEKEVKKAVKIPAIPPPITATSARTL